MITIEALQALGADTEEGLKRCMNNETFYLRMVDMALKENGLEKLETAVAEGNWREAFEAAHAIKGVSANLALTPIREPASEITELLRPCAPIDCGSHLAAIREQYDRFRALLD